MYNIQCDSDKPDPATGIRLATSMAFRAQYLCQSKRKVLYRVSSRYNICFLMWRCNSISWSAEKKIALSVDDDGSTPFNDDVNNDTALVMASLCL